MLIKEINKINNIEYKRYTSDSDFYIKKIDSEELFNEIVVLKDIEIKIIETDVKIIITEFIDDLYNEFELKGE